MARRRTAHVRESFEELQQLRDYYQGTPNAPLMQLLLLLREDQSRTIAECAEICGISVRKAERVWKRYREGGMSQILSRNYCGAQPSDRSLPNGQDKTASIPEVLNSVGKILETADVSDAIRSLRSLLYRLCPSIDYIAIRMSMLSDMDNRRLRLAVSYITLPDRSVHTNIVHEHPDLSVGEAFLKEGIQSGMDLSAYQLPPTMVDLYSARQDRQETYNDFPIATLLLFKSKDGGEISQDDLDKIERIRPFLSTLVANIGSKENFSGLPVRITQDALSRMSEGFRLSYTQSQVLMLVMFGYSYRDIASSLSVSISTVKSHLRSIYRSLGVSNKGQAIAQVIGFIEGKAGSKS